eukprot:340578_1
MNSTPLAKPCPSFMKRRTIEILKLNGDLNQELNKLKLSSHHCPCYSPRNPITIPKLSCGTSATCSHSLYLIAKRKRKGEHQAAKAETNLFINLVLIVKNIKCKDADLVLQHDLRLLIVIGCL